MCDQAGDQCHSDKQRRINASHGTGSFDERAKEVEPSTITLATVGLDAGNPLASAALSRPSPLVRRISTGSEGFSEVDEELAPVIAWSPF
jgi:hypothetical protein